jgi:hypothetical protein
MLRVSRPMLVVVLNDWVTETKHVADALFAQEVERKVSNLLAPQALHRGAA